MTIWFTGDTHFGHANIIKYCDRPFSDVDEMDNFLIDNWNNHVKPGDTVYHVGDFTFVKKEEQLRKYMCLNGEIHLIRGNHDYLQDNIYRKYFASVSELKTVKVSDKDNPNGRQGIILCHYALRVWAHSHHGYWHLYGHSHGTLPDDPTSLSLDVGVDPMSTWLCGTRQLGTLAQQDYRPISYDEVKHLMWRFKAWEAKDHHGKK